MTSDETVDMLCVLSMLYCSIVMLWEVTRANV